MILIARDAGFTLEETQMPTPQDRAIWDHDLLAETPTPIARALRDSFDNFCLWEL